MSDETDCFSEKLDEVIAECIRAEEAGEPVDRATLLAAHPDLADVLREFFADRDRLRQLAGGMKGWSRQRAFVPPKVRYFGDYELLEEIARGGMGVVYKARQTSLNRIVAVKMILSGHLAEADDVKRFQSEAEAAASLTHPSIVAVHEVGLHHGQHYFSMDYIEGSSLAELVLDHPLPARRAAGYVRSIAEAVHYAHGQGVLHRDLKPSNILLDADDHVHVTDFGLARRVQGDSKLTQTGQILGTPSYLAPEQAAGKRGLIGPASDIYSLGVILYELLTGRPPFQSDSAVETIRQVLDTQPVSPRMLNPAIPRDVETICLKCLQKEPYKRYPTAQHLADDLRRFLAGQPITARPVGRAERAWRWCRRNPAIAGLTVLLCLLLVVASGASVIVAAHEARLRDEAESLAGNLDVSLSQHRKLNRDLADEQQRTEAARRTAENRAAKLNQANHRLQEQTQTLQSQSELLRSQAGDLESRQRDLQFSLLRLAREQAIGNEVRVADQQLDKIPPELRGWEWRYAKRLCRPDLLTLPGNGGEAFLADGKHFVSGLGADLVIRRISDGGIELSLEGHSTRVHQLVVTQDGSRICSAAAAELIVWSAEGDLIRRIRSASPVKDIAVAADGEQLAAGCDDGVVRIWAISDGTLIRELHRHSGAVTSIAFSPDGQWLLSGSTDPPVVMAWDVSTGEQGPDFDDFVQWSIGLEGDVSLGIFDIEFAPHGGLVAIANADLVKLLSFPDCKELHTLSSHIGSVLDVCFSPNGHLLATASSDGTIRLWDVATAVSLKVLPWHETPVNRLAFSPDGRYLLSADGSRVKLWNISPDWGVRSLTACTDGVYSLNFSADGRLLAYGGGRYMTRGDKRGRQYSGRKEPEDSPAEIRVRDVVEDRLVFSVDVPRPDGFRFGTLAVALSPDGTQVAAGGCNRSIRIWEVASGRQVATFEDVHSEVRCLSFTPDGRFLAVAGGHRVTLWNLETGETVRHIPSAYAAFAPHQDWIITYQRGSSGFLEASHIESGEPVWRHEVSVPAWRFAVSPDGKYIALAVDRRTLPANRKDECAIIIDAETGLTAQTLQTDGERDDATDDYIISTYSVAFSPDGARLATAGADKTVRVWDVASGRQLLVFRHENQVFDVKFSPDGRWLASGSGHWCGPRPGEVRIWDGDFLEASDASPKSLGE